jgi:hypothetical protein
VRRRGQLDDAVMELAVAVLANENALLELAAEGLFAPAMTSSEVEALRAVV